jgi:hypothetical protein
MKSIRVLLCVFTLLAGAAGAGEPADLILKNGRILTLDAGCPVASALAVRGDRIVAVGAWEQVAPWAGERTAVVDLAGAVAYPGFVDSHAHVGGLGRAMEILDLTGAANEADVAERVRRAAVSVPRGDWILGRGWDQNRWPGRQFPTHASLTAAAPDHPVVLTRVDGHAIWVNRRAMERAALGEHPTQVPGGEILLDGEGRPTGVFVDLAGDLVESHIPAARPDEVRRRLRAAMERCAALGLTQVHDAGIGPVELAEYRALLQADQMPVRIWAMLQGEEGWLESQMAGGPTMDPTGRLAIGAVKMYADGALGSRGAWLLAPYTDRPETSGLPVNPVETLERLSRLCARHGFQACTHAIGDRANRTVLDVYQRVLAGLPDGGARRFRIEHAQVLAMADIPRFHALGVIPAMQPTHCTSDMPWAVQRLGPERSRYAYAWQSLLRTGAVIPTGSDFPVEAPDPLLGFYAAVTRQDPLGQPPGGWTAVERMTREQALRGMTEWSALAACQERDKGTLSVGKWADVTVLDRDLLAVPERDILGARVLLTLVGGRIVHDGRVPKEPGRQ